jgi:hypothetical protein
LAKKRPPVHFPAFADGAGLILEQIKLDRELLNELFEHYGISPVGALQDTNRLFELVFRLAKDHVPGFQWKQGTGARTNLLARVMRLAVANFLRTKNDSTLEVALEHMSKPANYADRSNSPEPFMISIFQTFCEKQDGQDIESLRRQYYQSISLLRVEYGLDEKDDSHDENILKLCHRLLREFLDGASRKA